jgi:hypothetical protein
MSEAKPKKKISALIDALVAEVDLEEAFYSDPEEVMRRPRFDFDDDLIDTVLYKPLRELKAAIEREGEGDADAAARVMAFRVKMG